MSNKLQRCPVCGYTKEDALIHMDHHLCKGKIPGYDTPNTPLALKPEPIQLTEEEKLEVVKLLQKGAVDYFDESDMEVHDGELPCTAEWKAALSALLDKYELRRRR
jgi:hypothetical protein